MRLNTRRLLFLLLAGMAASCSSNPYAATNRAHKKQVKAHTQALRTFPALNPEEETLQQGNYWVGTTNFSMRRPNYVVIHHTAQNSTEQTLKTFTEPATQVSAHYVIGKDGAVYHMLHDYMRAWHAGSGKWGNNTDLNSSSIGIELDNNGAEPFTGAQINSLLKVLAILKKTHHIPTANFIGHSDIAPVRKEDPNPTFPWKLLAENGYGLWYDEGVLDDYFLHAATLAPDTTVTVLTPDTMAIALAPDSTATVDSMAILDSATVVVPEFYPAHFNPQEALRIIGYDVQDKEAAIRAFKLHFIQTDITPVLTEQDKIVLYNLYKKYL
ncbi:N-acetylmuramoyl-L-alanine amidase [Pontibacter diazotrophicus]|uniref:N-acetylmuramoyl-L-alanine amidase n=1 Tax=Pontibacter diazotrophicus TaxID=1400979 RepID=A0A3D8LD81_9BACT|nr:N-acetylmuramoyl-L-alanine amidase [Pontibacter diazotrophicus]RDV15350.1 N-acetylmuramoyl-L-alanine amidase [Pontibacter diazotrophicus]